MPGAERRRRSHGNRAGEPTGREGSEQPRSAPQLRTAAPHRTPRTAAPAPHRTARHRTAAPSPQPRSVPQLPNRTAAPAPQPRTALPAPQPSSAAPHRSSGLARGAGSGGGALLLRRGRSRVPSPAGPCPIPPGAHGPPPCASLACGCMKVSNANGPLYLYMSHSCCRRERLMYLSPGQPPPIKVEYWEAAAIICLVFRL